MYISEDVKKSHQFILGEAGICQTTLLCFLTYGAHILLTFYQITKVVVNLGMIPLTPNSRSCDSSIIQLNMS
jgi:hypothetical protein